MIPKGYALYEYTDNYIVVMVTDFLLMLEDAPKYIEYDNKTYIREMIQAALQSEEAGDSIYSTYMQYYYLIGNVMMKRGVSGRMKL